jgi:hypothetical protein
MYEHVGLATILLLLALAGNLGEREPPCCEPKVTVGAAVLVLR